MTPEAITKSLALAASFGWLAYWTGRWYKEWYFLQFGIPYETLGFNAHYYVFGSWVTIATAICLLLLVGVPLTLARCRLWWPHFALSVALAVAAGVLQIWHPRFKPEGALWTRILGSGEIVVMLCGLLALIVLILSLLLNKRATRYLERARVPRALPLPVLCIASFLLCWVYFAIMGYFIGTYHGKAAIWEGRMGTRWVKHDGSWWVFAVRADADRNFILDRVTGKSKAIKDEQIDEWGGAVTPEPK